MVSKRIRNTQSPPLVELGEFASKHPDCISLGQGAPHYYPPDWIFDLLRDDLTNSDIHRYTPDHGLESVRNSVIAKLKKDQEVTIGLEQIVLTPGANQAFFNVLQSITDPGDEIILFSPYYFNHYMACTMLNVTPIIVPLEHSFTIDLLALSKVISSRTRAIVLVNPGNPTGVVHHFQELQELIDLSAQHDIIVIADETYEYFTYGKKPHIPLATFNYDKIIGLGSFSKTFGIPGWRLGYYYGPELLISESIKVQDTIGICAPRPSQLLGKHLIENRKELIDPVVKMMKENHKLAVNLLEDIEWFEATPSQGAYYLFPKQNTPISTIKLVRRLITEFGVYLVPGNGFGESWNRHCRISFANVQSEQLEEAFSKLSHYKI